MMENTPAETGVFFCISVKSIKTEILSYPFKEVRTSHVSLSIPAIYFLYVYNYNTNIKGML